MADLKPRAAIKLAAPTSAASPLASASASPKHAVPSPPRDPCKAIPCKAMPAILKKICDPSTSTAAHAKAHNRLQLTPVRRVARHPSDDATTLSLGGTPLQKRLIEIEDEGDSASPPTSSTTPLKRARARADLDSLQLDEAEPSPC